MSAKAKTGTLVIVTAVISIGALLIFQQWQRHHGKRDIFSTKVELSSAEAQYFSRETGMLPQQVAAKLFDACARQDWDEVAKYFPPNLLSKDPQSLERFKAAYGGMRVVSVGRPFRAALTQSGKRIYPGVFVPYEIRLKDGEIKRWQLAIRCDNAEDRWYWDGGM